MEALIVAIVIAYAIKKMAESSHHDWQTAKTANRTSTKGRRFPRRAASAIQHDIGYWSHQVANGFPQARHGLHAGWRAGRQAQEQGHAARLRARTDQLEGRAHLIRELRDHHSRQEQALAEIRAATTPQPGPRAEARDGQQGTAAPTRRVDGKPETTADTRFFDLRESGYTGPVDQDGNIPGQAGGAGCLYAWGAEHSLYHWPADTPADACGKAREASRSGGTYVACAHPLGGHEVILATFTAGAENPADGGEAPQVIPAASGSAAPDTGRPTNQEGTTMSADTTYDSVLATMNADREAAEARAADQDSAVRQASAAADEMQALDVDTGTLGAMADHLDAQQAAAAAQRRCVETAEAVTAALQRNHAQLAEAHKDAPVQAADKEFYAA